MAIIPKTPDDELEEIIEIFYCDYDSDSSHVANALILGSITIQEHNKQCEILWNRHMKPAVAKLKAREARIATEARIDEMERLNIYYLRHDGEGEHQLAAQFDVRIAQLKNNSMPDETKGGGDDQ